jgi:glutathione synthase/RimK-type ligase-like ATP-grasp enzyme
MKSTPKMLIVTSDDDPSIRLFEREAAAVLVKPIVVHYNTSPTNLARVLDDDYQYVYFRDPFNSSSVTHEVARTVSNSVSLHMSSAYYVDAVKSLDNMLFEDKWIQYTTLPELMPYTEITQSIKDLDTSKYFIKKRISSRARGIVLSVEDFPNNAKPSDYIIQLKLNINTEYRVFMIGGKVVLPLGIKRSKSVDQAVKIVSTTSNVSPEIMTICENVFRETSFDFMGLDIAETNEGYFLLEINRSPQFKAYLKLSSINLATSLNRCLLIKNL